MTPSAWRLSDTRFLLILLLPLGTLLDVLQHPETAFWGAIATSIIFSAVDALWPGAQRSPAPVGAQPHLRWLLRLYVPVQCVLLAAAPAVALRLDLLHVAALGRDRGSARRRRGASRRKARQWCWRGGPNRERRRAAGRWRRDGLERATEDGL